MSIEKITSKIISDAQEQANVVINQAKAEGDEIVAEASTKAEKIVSEAKESGIDEKAKLISRRKSVADIDGRKIALEAKQALIAECFDKAIDKITALDKEEYLTFLAEIVKATGYIDGELIFNEEEAKSIGPDLIEKLGREIAGCKIALSNETEKIRGGFILRKGSVFINGTIEALVDEAKEDLVSEVAGILFQ